MTEILNNVKANGDAALREYSAKFDKTTVAALQVSEAEIAAAGERLSDELKQAMAVAVKNIETFHNAQQLQAVDVETLPGALPAGHLPGRLRRTAAFGAEAAHGKRT